MLERKRGTFFSVSRCEPGNRRRARGHASRPGGWRGVCCRKAVGLRKGGHAGSVNKEKRNRAFCSLCPCVKTPRSFLTPLGLFSMGGGIIPEMFTQEKLKHYSKVCCRIGVVAAYVPIWGAHPPCCSAQSSWASFSLDQARLIHVTEEPHTCLYWHGKWGGQDECFQWQQ